MAILQTMPRYLASPDRGLRASGAASGRREGTRPVTTTRTRRPPPAPAGPALSPLTRIGLALLGLALLALGLLLWTVHQQEAPARPRLLAAEELAALPDARLEDRIIGDLAQRLVYQGYVAGAWRTFAAPARQLYIVATVEESLRSFGLSRFLADQGKADVPSPAEAAEAYAAIGLAEPAAILGELQARLGDGGAPDAGALAGLLRRHLAAIATPAARAQRLAFIRAHLAELAAP